MSIRLRDGRFTRAEAPDRRLRRLLQVASDLSHKPISECRVLDLACLEGHYGIEFSMHGARSVCVDIRDANLAKTAYAVDQLGLTNCDVYKDDVRNLSKETYGTFDIIICSGILYHLQGADAAALIARLGECCTGVCIIDTYVAAREAHRITIGEREYGGYVYKEHDAMASAADKVKDLWASIDNESSFWFAPRDVADLLHEAGFTSCVDVLLPTHPELTFDRRMFAAVKGERVSVLTSPMTETLSYERAPVMDFESLHPYQVKRSVSHRLAKAMLPQGVKNAIKPTLRKLGLLKTNDVVFPLKN